MTIEEAKPAEGESFADVISRRADHCDLVIVGGGDGTLNSAASGLAYTGLPLGVLPLGTANDFARTVGIPNDPVKAAEIIAAGNAKPVDLGEVNGHLFFNVASIGFSAELAARTERTRQEALGRAGIRHRCGSHPVAVTAVQRRGRT